MSQLNRNIGVGFITNLKVDDLGQTLYIMSTYGHVFFKVYHYNDGDDNLYLADLHVEEGYRHKGWGRKALKLAEKQARLIGAKKLYLWVKRDSWMRLWYEREGFRMVKKHEMDIHSVWMSKIIKQEEDE